MLSEGVGVSDDSEDEDPLSLTPAAKTAAANDTADLEIIPISHEVDADGAPILSQLANLPIAPRTATVATNGSVTKAAADADFLHDVALPPEDDYLDWNFSVKFFQFIRAPPKPLEPSTPAATDGEPAVISTEEARPDSPPLLTTKSKPTKVKASPAARGGRCSRGGSRGRKRGGGSSKSKRTYESDDLEYSSDEPKKSKAKKGGRGSRGRGGGGGATKRSRYIESSAEEESSESEEEVLARPVTTSSGRPSRNCRRSTNYADIEKAGDVLDYLLN